MSMSKWRQSSCSPHDDEDTVAAAGLRLEPRLGRPQPAPADDPAGAPKLLWHHGAGTYSGRLCTAQWLLHLRQLNIPYMVNRLDLKVCFADK